MLNQAGRATKRPSMESVPSPTRTPEDGREGSQFPYCVVIGDFNTGKSALLNALIRQDLLPTAREECSRLPVLLRRQAEGETDFFCGILPDGKSEPLVREQFRNEARWSAKEGTAFAALVAAVRPVPFSRLVFIDSPGLSSNRQAKWQDLANGVGPCLAVIVLDIEYWALKHTFELIAAVRSRYPDIVVVANKADQLNANDIARIAKTLPSRLQDVCGLVAPVFLVSAALETRRLRDEDEERAMTRKPVLTGCDAAFDALRVFLFEWESQFVVSDVQDDSFWAWTRRVRLGSCP